MMHSSVMIPPKFFLNVSFAINPVPISVKICTFVAIPIKNILLFGRKPELSELIKTCWVITSGIAGTENQAVGIAEALGIHPVIKRIKLKAPWRQLSPWLTLGHARALAADSDPIEAPWPDLLIACGRQSIGMARHVREQSNGNTFIVQ